MFIFPTHKHIAKKSEEKGTRTFLLNRQPATAACHAERGRLLCQSGGRPRSVGVERRRQLHLHRPRPDARAVQQRGRKGDGKKRGRGRKGPRPNIFRLDSCRADVEKPCFPVFCPCRRKARLIIGKMIHEVAFPAKSLRNKAFRHLPSKNRTEQYWDAGPFRKKLKTSSRSRCFPIRRTLRTLAYLKKCRGSEGKQ